jgi:hypothetical protein
MCRPVSVPPSAVSPFPVLLPVVPMSVILEV